MDKSSFCYTVEPGFLRLSTTLSFWRIKFFDYQKNRVHALYPSHWLKESMQDNSHENFPLEAYAVGGTKGVFRHPPPPNKKEEFEQNIKKGENRQKYLFFLLILVILINMVGCQKISPYIGTPPPKNDFLISFWTYI